MDDLKDKYNGSSKSETKTPSKDPTIIDMIADKLNYVSFGLMGTYFKWICETIYTKGVWGWFQSIIVFTINLLKKSQYYPNQILHYSFGFVTKPFENLNSKFTKNTSRPKQPT